MFYHNYFLKVSSYHLDHALIYIFLQRQNECIKIHLDWFYDFGVYFSQSLKFDFLFKKNNLKFDSTRCQF